VLVCNRSHHNACICSLTFCLVKCISTAMCISHISSCSTPILDPVRPMPKLCGTAMTRLECRNFCGRTRHCKAGNHRPPTSGTSHMLPPQDTSSRLLFYCLYFEMAEFSVAPVCLLSEFLTNLCVKFA